MRQLTRTALLARSDRLSAAAIESALNRLAGVIMQSDKENTLPLPGSTGILRDHAHGGVGAHLVHSLAPLSSMSGLTKKPSAAPLSAGFRRGRVSRLSE